MSTCTNSSLVDDFGTTFVVRPDPILIKPGGRYGLTLISDVHLGAASFDRGPLDEELQEARIQGDAIDINGDLFDAVIPADKKRFRPSAVAPSMQGRDDLANAQLELAVDLFGDYADLIRSVGCGNHEDSLVKYGGIDLTRLFVRELNRIRRPGQGKVHYAGYCGFLDTRFENKRLGLSASLRGFYHHGTGNSSAKNLQTMLRSVEGVDYFWIGHHHQRHIGHLQRISCNPLGQHVIHRQVRTIFTGAYLRTYNAATDSVVDRLGRQSNYQTDALMSPHGLGGARLIVKFADDGLSYSLKVVQ